MHLFEGYGIELEYMIVDRETLSVRPLADKLLEQVGGSYEMEVELGSVAWSNELALHVIELKTNGPTQSLSGLGATFREHVQRMDEILEPLGARLLPTAMHPWMDPETELRLWPHEHTDIYQTFHRIFNCRGHGWANLQSTHINLPFADDPEFARLHAAIRVVLPLLPGLSASSPFVEGTRSAFLDARLEAYRHNADSVFSVMGHVIPEPVFSTRDYQEGLLESIYRDLAPLDRDGVLRHEWVNARGCIARFDRMALEIRLLDVQECPEADIAVAGAVIEVVRALVEEAWVGVREQQRWHERELAEILLEGIRDADQAVISNRRFLETFGYPERGRTRMRDLWQHLIESVAALNPSWNEWHSALDLFVREGCLATRIVDAAGLSPDRERLREIYGSLADCLTNGELFRAGS